MNDVDVVLDLFAAIEGNDMDNAAVMLADGFTFSGPVPEPVNGSMWLGLHGKFHDAFPDFSFNLDHAHVHGDVIHVTVALSGTHEGTLDLSPMGLPSVPATGNTFQLPHEELSVSVADGIVQSVVGAPVQGGGVMGILSQLGVEMPPHDH